MTEADIDNWTQVLVTIFAFHLDKYLEVGLTDDTVSFWLQVQLYKLYNGGSQHYFRVSRQ